MFQPFLRFNVLKAVMHYNTPDVSKDVVYEIARVAVSTLLEIQPS